MRTIDGIDYSEFDNLINQVEKLGADMDQISEMVLDAGSEPAKQAYINNLPYDITTPEGRRRHAHARDNVKVSKTKTAKKSKNKYRVVSATKKLEGGKNEFEYLYYVEHGTSKMPAEPWLEKANREAQVAANGPMLNTLTQIIDKSLG